MRNTEYFYYDERMKMNQAKICIFKHFINLVQSYAVCSYVSTDEWWLLIRKSEWGLSGTLDINSYYKLASFCKAGPGCCDRSLPALLTGTRASPPDRVSALAERAVICQADRLSRLPPSPSLPPWVVRGCHTGSVSPGWRLPWDVHGGVWWNPAVPGAKLDWQWTLAASPENKVVFVRPLSCNLDW